jgi:enediyne biosynthesis protein E4
MNTAVFLLLAQSIRFSAVPTPPPFVLQNSPTPQKHMVETMPGGIAVLDYNSDGRPDLFFPNGASLPSLKKSEKHHNRLYRNDGNFKFTDVTTEAGLAGEGYALGATAADFDNDGHTDLFVAGLNHNTLYRNLGNGRFADITAASQIKSNEWSIAAAWLDYDNDGLLDLFVTNYGKIDLANPRFCGDSARNLRVYCHPRYYEPRPNQLYRNRGNGVFEDVSVSSGIVAHKGRGMSIALADYDNDGRLDIFVSNDGLPNFLFHNLGAGKFEENALLAGIALLDHGRPVSSMGLDLQDYDNDGLPDLAITALNGETFPLFRNQGKGLFTDQTSPSQIGRLSNTHSGWGVGWVDFDNDGLKDLFTANAHVNDLIEKFEAALYRQPNKVFRNLGNGKFALADAGLDAAVKAHRGAAFADFDGDGRTDVVVTALGEATELWQNTSPKANYLDVQLRGHQSNRDAIGAQVQLGKQLQIKTSAVSYASSVSAPLHFGLGAQSTPVTLEILWPSGRKQVLKDVAPNQLIKIEEPENPPAPE